MKKQTEVLDSILERSSSANSHFLRWLEEWLMANIQVEYGKTDENIVKETSNRYKSAIAANIQYHEQLSEALSEDEPVMARQHRLLAQLYGAIISNE
jgi:hypothetical protein